MTQLEAEGLSPDEARRVTMLEGFAGGADDNRDRVLRFSELRNFVRRRVEELTEKRQQPVAEAPEKRLGDPPLLVLAR